MSEQSDQSEIVILKKIMQLLPKTISVEYEIKYQLKDRDYEEIIDISANDRLQ